jgi:tetratricopeptide (TPR) repeat protein
VLEQQPYYLPALLVIARTEQASGNYQQAMDYVKRAKKTQPDQYMIYELGGDISMQAKNYREASEYYNQIMTIRPTSEIVVKQSNALMRLSETEQAIDVLQSWLSDHSDDTGVRLFLGNAYLAIGANAKALESFESVIKEQSDNVAALNNLAWLYSLKNESKALEYAEKAYKIRPNDSAVQDTYGWVLVQQGQVENGRRILESAMNELSAVPEVRYHYAVALMKTGEEKKAREIFAELLESDKPFDGREQV